MPAKKETDIAQNYGASVQSGPSMRVPCIPRL